MRRFKVVYSILDRERGYRIIRRFFTRHRNPKAIRTRFEENAWWGMRVHSIHEISTAVKK